MMKPTKTTILATCFLMTSMAGCALQRDVVNLEERMIAAERQNQELQIKNQGLEKQIQDELQNIGSSSQNAEKNLRTQYASVNVNLDTLDQEVRLIGGRIDEVEHLLNRKTSDYDAEGRKQQELIDELSATVSQIDQRLQVLERYLSIDRKSNEKPVANAEAPAAATDLYAAGKQAFDKGEWDKARELFGQLIKEKPQSENADNAQFWIGESYYNEQWFEKAILEYQTVIEQYPKGNKVPAAMLKQGLAFLKLGDKSNARLVLKRLEQSYPKSNEASVASAKLKDL